MKNYFYLASAFVLATLWGCQNEEDVFDNTQKQTDLVISASFEGNADSRTVLQDGKLYWSEDDELSVFLGLAEGKNQEFELIDGAGTKSGSFQGKNGQIIIGSTEAGNYTWSNVAYYPYDKNITIKKDDSSYKLDVTLPVIQNYAQDSYGPNAYPMVAVTENKNDYEFIFKNFMSIVTLSLKGNATITKVILKSESKPLAGAAIVEATRGKADIDFVEGGDVSSIVVLDCGNGIAINQNSYTKFSLVMPPGTYPAKDLTLTVYDNQNRFQSYNVTGEFIINPNQTRNTNRSFDAPQEVVKVKLNGAGSYADIAAAVSAITDKTVQNTITLAAGTYTLPTSLSDLNLVIEGENADLPGEVIVDMSNLRNDGSQHQYGAKSVTFKNLTMKRPSQAYGGLAHSDEEHYENCIVEGTLVTYAPVVTASKTTFKQTSNALYNVHIYSPGTMEFEECTFVCEGKSIYMHHDGNHSKYDVTIKNSTFTANQVVDDKTAIQMHTEDGQQGDNGVYGTLTVEGTTATGFDSSINGGLWYELNNSTKNITYNFTKTINGVNPDGFEKVAEKEYNIFNANGLVYAAKNLFPNGGTFNITADINMTDVEYPDVKITHQAGTILINGNDKTIKNMGNQLISFTGSATSVTVKDLTLDGTKFNIADTGTNGIAAFIGYAGTSREITLDNCHVVNAEIEGGHWTGGLVGYAAGYNAANNGPVFETLTIKDCSVKNSFIIGHDTSCGAVIGHATGDLATLVKIEGVEVIGNTITTDEKNKAGVILGTVGAAGPAAWNGELGGTYITDATVSGNTVTANGVANTKLYGRQGTLGGVLYIDGVQVIFEADQLAANLTADKTTIEVILANNIDLPITDLGSQTPSSGEYKLGGESTQAIVIDLNGQKLNITTTYWSAIGAKNDNATITIKNGSMTSSGNSAGTWNAFDVRLSNCNYVIEDVTFDKPVALDNVGKSTKMNTVTINDNGDRYALWITAEGQTVEIDGLTVNTSGRGIKIDEEYVDAPAKVTLKVSNANFTTAKKAAILVKSAAGADITLSNVNINNVAADKVNAVWVDEDVTKPQIDGKVNPCYGSYGLVTVTGGNLVLEGTTKLTEGVLSNEDAKAYYIVNAAGLNWLTSEVNTKNNNFMGKTVNLLVNIDLAGAAQTRIGQYNATSFEGTFDGMSHTVSNFTITASDAEKNGNYATAFFGRATTATVIKGLTLDKATIEGHHWTAALVGYNHGKVENCHVTNSVINCSHVSGDACGDKAGAIAGICADGAGKLIGCSATDCTVKGVRDVGQLVGAAAIIFSIICLTAARLITRILQLWQESRRMSTSESPAVLWTRWRAPLAALCSSISAQRLTEFTIRRLGIDPMYVLSSFRLRSVATRSV